jgi:hypothetical protein
VVACVEGSVLDELPVNTGGSFDHADVVDHHRSAIEQAEDKFVPRRGVVAN